MKQTLKKDIIRIITICISALIMAINIKTFVRTGGLLPGGATGLTILIQRACESFFQIEIPYTILNVLINCVPIYIGFRYIGKKFTLYSCLMIFLTGIFTDLIPNYVVTYDILLISIFGGIINGFAISQCLRVDATTGGTDFISALYSKKYGIDVFNYILFGNAILLMIAGIIYGWESALYSIIYQYVTTEVLHVLYKRYQKHTLFIITNKPKEVYKTIKDMTNHGATLFKGVGLYKDKERNLIYSVISSDELHFVIKNIKKVDEKAFIDVIHSDRVDGWFFQRPTT